MRVLWALSSNAFCCVPQAQCSVACLTEPCVLHIIDAVRNCCGLYNIHFHAPCALSASVHSVTAIDIGGLTPSLQPRNPPSASSPFVTPTQSHLNCARGLEASRVRPLLSGGTGPHAASNLTSLNAVRLCYFDTQACGTVARSRTRNTPPNASIHTTVRQYGASTTCTSSTGNGSGHPPASLTTGPSDAGSANSSRGDDHDRVSSTRSEGWDRYSSATDAGGGQAMAEDAAPGQLTHVPSSNVVIGPGSSTAVAAAAAVAATAISSARQRPGGGPNPRRVMCRIKEATSMQDLAFVVRRSTATGLLPRNALLLVAALSRLARLATDQQYDRNSDRPTSPTATATATGTSAALAPLPPASAMEPRAQHPGSKTGSSTSSNSSSRAGSLAEALLLEMAVLVAQAVPVMTVGELSSAAWSLGKLRPLWGRGPNEAAVGATADAIAQRLASDWEQHAPPPPSSPPPFATRIDPSVSDPRIADGAAVADSERSSSGATGTDSSSGPRVAPAAVSAPTVNVTRVDGVRHDSQESSGGGPTDPPTDPRVNATSPLWFQARTQDVANLAWGLLRAGRGGAAYDGAWQWLAGSAGDVLWSGQGREVANLVWAFASSGRPHPEVFDNLLVALVSQQRGLDLVRQLREEECTAVIWALATAYGRLGGRSGGREYLPPPPRQSLGRLSVEVADGGGSAQEAAVAAMRGTAAYGDSEAEVRRPDLGRALARLGPHAVSLVQYGKLTGRQVGSMMWSLVVLQDAAGLDLDPVWLQSLCRRAARTARHMDDQALGNAAWTLGKLRSDEGGALAALCAAARAVLHVSKSGMQAVAAPSDDGHGTASGMTSTAMGTTTAASAMSSRSLLQLLWACGRLRHVDEKLLSVAQDQLLSEVPRFDPWSVATLTFALAALDAHSQSLFNALCRRAAQLLPPPYNGGADGKSSSDIIARDGGGGDYLSGPQMVSVAAALARVEHYDGGLLDALCESLSYRVRQLQPREVAALVGALDRLEHAAPALLVAVEERVVCDMRPYGPAELVTLLYGFAAAEVRAERLFTRAAVVLQRQLADLDSEGLVRLAEAFAAAALPDDDLFEGMAGEALKSTQRFSRAQMERLEWAFRSLGYADTEQLLEVWRTEGAGAESGGPYRGHRNRRS